MIDITDPFIFVYVNTKNEVKIQHIIDVSQNEIYFQGISQLEYETDKLKTFKKDRVIQAFNSIELANNFINSGIEQGEFYQQEAKPQTFDVCFTGFKESRKKELTSMSENAGLTVRKKITVNLQILCYGYNAGPTKIKDARHLGVLILNEDEFLHFLDTGDVTSYK